MICLSSDELNATTKIVATIYIYINQIDFTYKFVGYIQAWRKWSDYVEDH